ncbi:helix-turn-helix domain-containing protein [Haloechinothrix halophila]|uniref:helix-turn-helix domain-containing protein n=1 Tax=Haloechinothrix halophila TaxID=1069073 RepID=UPI0004194B1F|nr:helix-turn-helix domain-containing protein [Haloechinothrix halophila]
MTKDEIESLPRVLTPSEFARLFGVGKSTVYDAIGTGRLPIEPIRIGNRWMFPTLPVIRLLGYEADRAAAEEGR